MCDCAAHWDTAAPCTCTCPVHAAMRTGERLRWDDFGYSRQCNGEEHAYEVVVGWGWIVAGLCVLVAAFVIGVLLWAG